MPVALEKFIASYHLRIVAIANFVPSAEGVSVRPVRPELILRNNALLVKFADSFEQGHARTLDMICISQP